MFLHASVYIKCIEKVKGAAPLIENAEIYVLNRANKTRGKQVDTGCDVTFILMNILKKMSKTKPRRNNSSKSNSM